MLILMTTPTPLTPTEHLRARLNDDAALAVHLIQRKIIADGRATVRTRDDVEVLAVRVMITMGLWTAREISEGLWMVERVPMIETDPEPEDEREPLAVDASIVGGC
jgi:hypothetical protein